jgi:dTDP-4-amino-4,6-dideoxygalactose transaminase
MEWRVPLADLDYDRREIDAVAAVVRSRWLTMGQVTRDFERRFAAMLGVKHAFAVANGTAALHLAHLVLGIGPGDEVIVPSLTFVATVNAVLYAGATPVFADIAGPDDLNISPADIERRIGPRTRAVVAMHYGGYPCAMGEIAEIAHRHHLSVIEDAAHAPGASLGGKSVGAWGDVACFSFFSNKNLAMGEGGMIVTGSDDLAQKLKLLRSHGMTSLTWDRHRGHAHSYDVVALGYNYRIDEIRSALGRVQLDKLSQNNERRRQLGAEYRRLLSDLPGLFVPFSAHPGVSACHLFPILLDRDVNRRAFMDRLRERGIQTSIHYPPVHQFTYYRECFGDRELGLAATDSVGLREVTLPLYPGMTDVDVQTVCRAVREVLAHAPTIG